MGAVAEQPQTEFYGSPINLGIRLSNECQVRCKRERVRRGGGEEEGWEMISGKKVGEGKDPPRQSMEGAWKVGTLKDHRNLPQSLREKLRIVAYHF